MDNIRAFIAVVLPQPIKTCLAQLQLDLGAKQDTSVKWVNPDGIHLTLKFLGNTTAELVPHIIDAMTASIKNISPFLLRIGELGAFPNTRSPRVTWVGLNGDIIKLKELQRHIDQALAPLGFPKETRPFSPHLTLGRIRASASLKERLRLGEILSSIKSKNRPSFHVNTISLMRSELTTKGAIYSPIAISSLGNTLSKSFG